MVDNPFGQYLDPLTNAVNSGFGNVLADPRMAGALLSIGGQLAQPQQFGQNTVSGLFQGLGAGGESVRAQDSEEEKRKENESKQSLREAQAGAAESRANTAEARAGAAAARTDTASARLALQQQEMEQKTERNRLGNILRFQGAYQKEVKRIQDQNKIAAYDPKAVQLPVPSFDEFIRTNPQISGALNLTAKDTAAASGEEGGASPPSEGLPVANPKDTARAPGYYQTPRGRAYWNGTGWQL